MHAKCDGNENAQRARSNNGDRVCRAIKTGWRDVCVCVCVCGGLPDSRCLAWSGRPCSRSAGRGAAGTARDLTANIILSRKASCECIWACIAVFSYLRPTAATL